MDGVTGAALAGLLAGAAVALPLGAIGVLLVQEAITAGWRTAAAGALGVGLVDTAYSVVAVLAGNSVNRVLAGHQQVVQLIGAALLTAVAARGLLGAWRAAVQQNSGQPAVIPSSRLKVTARYVTLTAVNPMTAIYFVALAAGSSATVHGLERSTAFVAGVFVASLTWQLLLVTMGSLAGSRLGIRARMATGLVGNLIVLGYAARMAASAG
ncbi:MAG TPA: LysE family transporter [Kineosporiaceae bacterium]|nr:LysE family transporter [Kineosporiaceae bacterium]